MCKGSPPESQFNSQHCKEKKSFLSLFSFISSSPRRTQLWIEMNTNDHFHLVSFFQTKNIFGAHIIHPKNIHPNRNWSVEYERWGQITTIHMATIRKRLHRNRHLAGPGSTRVWTQGLMVPRQALYTWTTPPPAPLDLGYFSDRVLCFLLRTGSDRGPLTYASCIARIADMHHALLVYGNAYSPLTHIPPGCSWTSVLPISASRVNGTRLTNKMYVFLFVFCSTGVWTQGLHLEPLHQPCFVVAVFKIHSHKLFVWAGFELRSSWSLPPE
jgi:hypothetical protein